MPVTFEDIMGPLSDGVKEYLETLRRKEIPVYPPPMPQYSDYRIREAQIKVAGFSMITTETVGKLEEMLQKHFGDKTLKTLEVCSGNAWWSKVLKLLGHTTTATDDWSGHWYGGETDRSTLAHPVERKDAVEAAKTSEDFDLLVVAWPCDVVAHDDVRTHMTYDIGKAWHSTKAGRPILYIGEGRYGCCASEKFFAHFMDVAQFYPWNFDGIHESVQLGYFS